MLIRRERSSWTDFVLIIFHYYNSEFVLQSHGVTLKLLQCFFSLIQDHRDVIYTLFSLSKSIMSHMLC